MISCTDFIPAYSELFKYLEKRGGKEAVLRFWEYLSDQSLNLRKSVEAKGLRGCWEYWTHTLNEEAADFEMELDEEEGVFRILMHACPSKGRLLEMDYITPYRNYCEHCEVIYARILEPLGFQVVMDMSNCDQAKCSLTVKRKDA